MIILKSKKITEDVYLFKIKLGENEIKYYEGIEEDEQKNYILMEKKKILDEREKFIFTSINYFKISEEDFYSETSTRELVDVRMMIAEVLRTEFKMSPTEISRTINKARALIYYYRKRLKNLLFYKSIKEVYYGYLNYLREHDLM